MTSAELETLDQLDTAVIRLDASGRIVQMNLAAEQCLQTARERALGKMLGDVVRVPEALDSLLSRRGPAGESRRLHELQLAQAWFDCSVRMLDGHDLLLELHNLEWERKRMQLQQREVQTGILQLLSRNLGHEIRNPLGGIRGAAQMLANESSSGELATLARLVMREADRIDELLLSFGQPELVQGEFDLYRLLDEVGDLVRVEFGLKPAWSRDFDPSIPLLSGDASAIRQVLLNLVRNACQADANNIVLRTRVVHDHIVMRSDHSCLVRLDVTDDGVGVPESLRQLLFLPLVSGRRDGTGLGLALSQQIASAHDGLLTYEPYESGQGSGSRFSLYLPVSSRPTSH